jgi:hypothetical protein
LSLHAFGSQRWRGLGVFNCLDEMTGVVGEGLKGSAFISANLDGVIVVVFIGGWYGGWRRVFDGGFAIREPSVSVVGHHRVLKRAAGVIASILADLGDLIAEVVGVLDGRIDGVVGIQDFGLQRAPKDVSIDFLFAKHFIGAGDGIAAGTAAAIIGERARGAVRDCICGSPLVIIRLLGVDPGGVISDRYATGIDLSRIRLLEDAAHHIIDDADPAVETRRTGKVVAPYLWKSMLHTMTTEQSLFPEAR